MIGRVDRLWRYPVKSMLGEACEELEVQARGIGGDRLFALRDGDGKLGSGKNGRRFRQVDGLFAFAATLVYGIPLIAFPDGRSMRADDPQIHAALSEALGMELRLEREQDCSHFDSGPLHLLSSGALAWLRLRLPESRTDARRFRPNIVVATPGDGQAEQAWANCIVRIGPEARIRITTPTARCRMTTLAQGDLPADPKVLRCIAQESELNFGVYAEVLNPGVISVGDELAIEVAP